MRQRQDLRPQLDVSFVLSDRGTYLDRRIFRWPYTISSTFHLDLIPVGMLTLIVQSVSGTIQAGDALLQQYHVGSGAIAHVTTPGAAAVHRAPPGMAASDETRLTIEEGGFLEYLPEPRILFRDSCLSQRLQLRLAISGTAVLSDGFTVHDPAGKDVGFRRFASEILVERPDGELLVADRIDLDYVLRRSGKRRAFSAFGTLIVASRAADLVENLRRQIAVQTSNIEGLYLAVSALPNGAGASLRVAAFDGRRLRQGLAAGWIASRRYFFGAEPAARRK